jgi:ABC-2 type transport system ATP-binding protein
VTLQAEGPATPSSAPHAGHVRPVTESVIHTDGLRKRYGRTDALRDLTMDVSRGEVFGFLGPNGAGKTTAVKLMLGLARPSGGTVRVLGAPAGDRAARRRIGYLPELFRYQGWLSAREVLRLHARLAGIDPRENRTETQRVLELTDLVAAADRRVGGYSKGMQQRLGLAVALIARPDLVFLDEPTSALDPVGRAEIRDLIRRLAAEGTTIFLNSHLLAEVEQVCDRVAIVDDGRVIEEGRLDVLLSGGVVRVKVETASEDAAPAPPAGFAPVESRDGWWIYPGLPHDRVPDLVAALVGAGLRVAAVETRQRTLEDRFRELLDRS